MNITKNNKTDFLELIIVSALFLLIIVIYVPVAIWEEEESFQKESRYRMQNLYDVQSFYSNLTGSFSPNYFEAMNLINAARDSALSDSLFIGERNITINNKIYKVDIDDSFSFEYDTTFGLKSFRKDSVTDTTLQISFFSDELGRSDSSFIRKKDLENHNSKNQFKVLREEAMKRVEAVEFYNTYIPDSSLYYCPLSKKPFMVEINDNNLSVSSPIEFIKEDRYFLFSFKAVSHGYIKGGRRSWD
jgi:hypothetical protein